MPRFEVHKAPRTIVDLLYPLEKAEYGKPVMDVVHEELRKSLNVQICIPAVKGKYAEWMVFADLEQKYGHVRPLMQWHEDWFISKSAAYFILAMWKRGVPARIERDRISNMYKVAIGIMECGSAQPDWAEISSTRPTPAYSCQESHTVAGRKRLAIKGIVGRYRAHFDLMKSSIKKVDVLRGS